MTDKSGRKQIRSFYFRLIIPGILTISAFIISIYVIFIPSLENNLINQKKIMTTELTQSAWSILQSYNDRVNDSLMNKGEAQAVALELIQMLRYGEESKDYFWVTDMVPNMIAHPYRPDLNGQNLVDYKDPNGKRLFVECVKVVEESGEGFVDYFWQWKDDESRIVPKLSYVKSFEPWGWIVGTGIYIYDVEDEISRLERNLVLVSIIIILFVSLSLIYILRTGLILEAKRQKAVSDLEDSRERYRSLVEASNEGTLLSMGGKISYVNPFFLEMFGCESCDIIGKNPEIIINEEDTEVIEAFREFMEKDSGILKLETRLKTENGNNNPVLLTISRISLGDRLASIIVAKELSDKQRMAGQIEELSEELQTSLLFMNQPVQLVARHPLAISMNATIRSCAEAMSRKNQNGILIRGPEGEYLGIVTDTDLRHRVIAKGKDYGDPVYSIMSSPVVSIADNALLFEALMSLQQKDVTHIAIKDPAGNITGLVSHEDLLEMQQNTTAFLMRQIEMASHADEIIEYSRRTRGIVNVLEQSGAKTRNINRIITTLTDAITRRFIDLAVEETGPPPAAYSFIALGSVGRGEQSLATDQDNGIIFEDVQIEKQNETQNYFLALGKKVNDWLNQAGYNYCRGNVMASNPRWCQSLAQWKTRFRDWIINAEPEAVLDASIFFDFRSVCGDDSLADELQLFVDNTSRNQGPFFYQMADQTLKFNSGSEISSLYKKNKSTGRNVFDSKKLIFPITAFCRIYAIHNQVKARSTISRLQNLNQSGKLSDELSENISQAYEFLMLLRFKAQLLAITKNQEINNEIPADLLTDLDKIQLKKTMSALSAMQTKMKLDFNI